MRQCKQTRAYLLPAFLEQSRLGAKSQESESLVFYYPCKTDDG